MNKDLTRGPVMRSMLLFAVPMILGNLLQQCCNIADTLIVGQFLGKDALAAVGSSFTLMTFLTSILLGLCMGSGALFSIRFGQRDGKGLREAVWASFVLIAAAALVLNVLAFACLDALKAFLRVPEEVWPLMRAYLAVIFFGIALYAWFRCPQLRGIGGNFRIRRGCLREIAGYSVLTCVQQSVMNLGILMVQGLVNSFGTVVMAAFAGFRNRLFHLHCPELRRGEGSPHPDGSEGRGCGVRAVLCGGVGAGVGVCRPADAPVCRKERNRHHSGGRPLPAH